MKKKSKLVLTLAAIAALVSIVSKDKKLKEKCVCEEEKPLE